MPGSVMVREFFSEQWFPQSRDELFAFFSDASNLDAITPPWLKFRTVTQAPVAMAQGAIIDYKLRIHGVPIPWRTEIKLWEPPTRFVDEQIHGPYRLWIHEHTFEQRDDGTLMRDHVRYAVRLDPVVHRLLVRPNIERIFAFRTQAMHQRFGEEPDSSDK
jgi:ligand-binding SRPBCC domain-containing protein